MVSALIRNIAKKVMPELDLKLKQAGIVDNKDEYIKKILKTSFMISIALSLISFLFVPNILTLLTIIIYFPLFFLYLMRYVDVKILKVKKEIDSEIIFAANFLIIELESGVPLDKAFGNMEKNYKYSGSYFGDVLHKVYLGTDMEDALKETMITVPSDNLRRIMWQLLNSLRSGTDPVPSLKKVVNHVIKDQKISVEEYGKKLSPMAMFYMMISIIVPSLGITMFVVIATMMGLIISIGHYVAIALLLGFIQFMFLSIVKSSRPSLSI